MRAEDNPFGSNFANRHFHETGRRIKTRCFDQNIRLVANRTDSLFPFATGMST